MRGFFGVGGWGDGMICGLCFGDLLGNIKYKKDLGWTGGLAFLLPLGLCRYDREGWDSTRLTPWGQAGNIKRTWDEWGGVPPSFFSFVGMVWYA